MSKYCGRGPCAQRRQPAGQLTVAMLGRHPAPLIGYPSGRQTRGIPTPRRLIGFHQVNSGAGWGSPRWVVLDLLLDLLLDLPFIPYFLLVCASHLPDTVYYSSCLSAFKTCNKCTRVSDANTRT